MVIVMLGGARLRAQEGGPGPDLLWTQRLAEPEASSGSPHNPSRDASLCRAALQQGCKRRLKHPSASPSVQRRQTKLFLGNRPVGGGSAVSWEYVKAMPRVGCQV